VGARWFRSDANSERAESADRRRLRELIAAAEQGGAGSGPDLAKHLVRLAAGGGDSAEALRLLSTVGPRTWLRLDDDLRSWSGWPAAKEEWRRIRDAAWLRSDPLAVLLTACSNNGHVRQSAVADPVMRRDRRLLPVLMIRTADWVEQVRDDAREAFAAALDAADQAGLPAAAGMAVAMRNRLRGDFALGAVTRALMADPVALAVARAGDDVQVRRLAYQVWLASADEESLFAAARTETDIVCAARCAEVAVDHAVRARRPGILEQLLSARSVRVRIAALTGLVRLDRPQAGQAFLADRSAMMRATAQWAMRRAGTDPAALYRTMIAAEIPARHVRGLVAGLGECGGGPADIDRVAAYLGHQRPRVRAEAVRAVRRLGGSLGQVATMLTDPAPVVVRAVTAALRAHPDPAPAARLWELLAADQPRHVRLGAFHQLIARDSWTRIEADLILITATDDRLRHDASADLGAWLHRDAATAYTTPSPPTRDRLNALIGAAEPALGADTARALRWHLDR
jgi:HEAT repeats